MTQPPIRTDAQIPDAFSLSGHINRIMLWSPVLLGVAAVLFGVVRANGAVMAPLIIQTLTFLVLRIPVAKLLLDRWSADGIWWSFPITNGFALVLAIAYYRYGGWRKTQGIELTDGASLQDAR